MTRREEESRREGLSPGGSRESAVRVVSLAALRRSLPMNILSPVIAAPVTPGSDAAAIFSVGQALLPHLERGERIDAAILREAMERAFAASDSSGAWSWKDAYEACEAASVLFLRKYGRALFRKNPSASARLAALTKIAGLLPSHTRRSEQSQALQQFSTPVPLGLAALVAAAITPADVVLEPSAGTGLLAILAEIAGGRLILNELAENARRSALLALSRRRPSAASTPRKSTIISTPAPRRPSC